MSSDEHKLPWRLTHLECHKVLSLSAPLLRDRQQRLMRCGWLHVWLTQFLEASCWSNFWDAVTDRVLFDVASGHFRERCCRQVLEAPCRRQIDILRISDAFSLSLCIGNREAVSIRSSNTSISRKAIKWCWWSYAWSKTGSTGFYIKKPMWGTSIPNCVSRQQILSQYNYKVQ